MSMSRSYPNSPIRSTSAYWWESPRIIDPSNACLKRIWTPHFLSGPTTEGGARQVIVVLGDGLHQLQFGDRQVAVGKKSGIEQLDLTAVADDHFFTQKFLIGTAAHPDPFPFPFTGDHRNASSQI